MTKKQRAARLKRMNRLTKERKQHDRFLFKARYGRQIKAVVTFWSEQLTSRVADFDNGERSEVQVIKQVEAIGAHARLAASLTPDQVARFERVLTQCIEDELHWRMLPMVIGLKYEPDRDSVLYTALVAAGVKPGKLVLPWDTQTHIRLSGVKVFTSKGEEKDLPLTA